MFHSTRIRLLKLGNIARICCWNEARFRVPAPRTPQLPPLLSVEMTAGVGSTKQRKSVYLRVIAKPRRGSRITSANGKVYRNNGVQSGRARPKRSEMFNGRPGSIVGLIWKRRSRHGGGDSRVPIRRAVDSDWKICQGLAVASLVGSGDSSEAAVRCVSGKGLLRTWREPSLNSCRDSKEQRNASTSRTDANVWMPSWSSRKSGNR